MAILKESQIIGNYTVQSFIKEGLYNETYRICTAPQKLDTKLLGCFL